MDGRSRVIVMVVLGLLAVAGVAAGIWMLIRKRKSEKYEDDAGNQTCPNGLTISKLLSCDKVYPAGTPGTPDGSSPLGLGLGPPPLVPGFKTCRDGTPVPLDFSCQDGVQQCQDGRIISKNSSCTNPFVLTPEMARRQKSKTCPDLTIRPVDMRCDEATQQCADTGRVISKYVSCTTGKSVVSPAPFLVPLEIGSDGMLRNFGTATGTVGSTGSTGGGVTGSTGGVTGSTGGVTGSTGGGVTGSTGSMGGVTGSTGSTGSMGGVTGSTGGVTGITGGVTGSTGGVTGSTGGGVTGSTGGVTGSTGGGVTGGGTPVSSSCVSQCASKCAAQCAAKSQCATLADIQRLVAAMRKCRGGSGASMDDAMRMLDDHKKKKKNGALKDTTPGKWVWGEKLHNCNDGTKVGLHETCPGEKPNTTISGNPKLKNKGAYALRFLDPKNLWDTADARVLKRQFAAGQFFDFITPNRTAGKMRFVSGSPKNMMFPVTLSGKAAAELKMTKRMDDDLATQIIYVLSDPK